MHTIRALLVLLGCLALGETAAYLTGIKLPGSIIGMGIAASLERSRRMAAYAGLGLTLNGVLTAAIAPIIIPVLGF